MQFGPYDVQVVSDGSYLLDGGSMFGVVPKVLWQGRHPADHDNRIELALNCLLLRGDGRVVLIDTGMGDHWTPREREQYGLLRPEGGLLDDLRRKGVSPQDVTDVVLTHLHFDHSGGVVRWDGGSPSLNFPRAVHWLQQQNLEWAQHPSERDRRSFREADLQALLQQPTQLRLLKGPGEFLPAISATVVSGHTPGQQLLRIGDGERSLLFCADLVPFASQVRLPWIAAFDLHPLLTLEEKKELLANATAERWILVFEHDPKIPAASIEYRDGAFVLREPCAL